MLIHIGYHKTGTTWLQQRLFGDPSVAGFHSWDAGDLQAVLVRGDPIGWSASAARDHFRAGLSEAGARGLTPVLSCERLSGNPFTGGYDTEPVARRLAAVFPDARILIVLREQRDMLLAVYRAYVRDGGTASLRAFLCPDGASPYPGFRFDFHEYHRAIALYHELFGPARVRTMAFEALRRDPNVFAAEVAAFAGAGAPGAMAPARVNEGLSAGMTALKRQCNHGLAGDLRHRWSRRNRLLVALCARGARLVPDFVESALDQAARREVDGLAAGRYGASNRETARLTRLDLEALGYPMARDQNVR